MPAPRPAATVILLRDADTASGLEVFMLRRHRRMAFLPNAWVFPGGRVEASDDLPGWDYEDGAFRAAALRETFEETGIWLGEHAPADALRAPLQAGEIPLASLVDAGAVPDLAQLHPWSWWITPEAEPKRYDTRFFVADCGDEGAHDDVENVDSRWVCPRWAMENGSVQAFPMAPPTWWTLYELSAYGDVESVLGAVAERPNRPIMPIIRFLDEGMQLLLPGHAEHPQPVFPGLPSEVGYADGRWVARFDGRELVAPATSALD